eukprot:2777532-Rhodomonas_salina.3
MSGTTIAYAAISLRVFYAMSGTGIAYAAISVVICAVRYCDSVWSALCVTVIAYGALTVDR